LPSPAAKEGGGLLIALTFSAAATSIGSGGNAPILLFDGIGTSPNDVAAVAMILNSNHLNYSTANSSELNQMSESQIRGFRLLIVPGGNFIDMGKSLTANTAAKHTRRGAQWAELPWHLRGRFSLPGIPPTITV